MKLELQPVHRDDAREFIRRHHSHHLPPIGYKFAIGVDDGQQRRGVSTVGRPVARHLDDGYTAEVTRCCSDGEVKNVASKLYAAAWRAARAMGYRRLITYTRADERGTSLEAAGFRIVHQRTRNESWDRPSRPRIDKTETIERWLWEAS